MPAVIGVLSGLGVSPKVIQYPYISQKTKGPGESLGGGGVCPPGVFSGYYELFEVRYPATNYLTIS